MNSLNKYIVAFAVSLSVTVDAGITQNAKKSIFPTTDAIRENDFVKDLFSPLIEDGTVEQQEADTVYTCGVPSKFRFENTGFEIHSPYAPQHESGGLEVIDVEGYYKEKWDNLLNDETDWYYDAILDNSMAFWVNDISTYVGYNDDTIDRIYLQWESIGGNTYYSLITHNKLDTSDMNIYEFISDTFTNKDKYTNINFIKSEPRAYIDDRPITNKETRNLDYDYKLLCKENNYEIIELGIRRAVSDLEANINWYTEIFSLSIVNKEEQIQKGETIDINGNIVKYAHIMLQEDDSFSISFFERQGTKATYGDLTIKSFENQLNIAHRNIMVNPFCCVDRWYDLHYALPLNSDTAAAKTLENIINKKGQLYTIFEITMPAGTENAGTGMFWTMVEPNGQIIQLQGPDTASEEVTIEFVTQPSYWDGKWCPQENTDEFKQYSFGDQICTITYATADSEDDDNEKDSSSISGSQLDRMIKNIFGSNNNNNGISISVENLFTIILSCLFLTVLGCIYFIINRKCFGSKNKLENGNNRNNNNVSYTYKTFN